MRGLFLLPACLLFSFACASAPQQSPSPPGKGDLTIEGVMRYMNIETGCWYLETSGGNRYELAGEDLQMLMEEGLSVSILARPMPGVHSTCQIGTIVEVIRILKMDKGDI